MHQHPQHNMLLVPEQTWEQIHIDHAGPLEGHMLLIIMEVKTKWLEVVQVTSTSSSATIMVLQSIFTRFGLPKYLVCNNGPGFIREEFSEFLTNNGITCILKATCHTCLNGLAEWVVRTIKSAMKKVTQWIFAERLSRFLFNYRIMPSAAIGISPAMVMFGHPIWTQLRFGILIHKFLRRRRPAQANFLRALQCECALSAEVHHGLPIVYCIQ